MTGQRPPGSTAATRKDLEAAGSGGGRPQLLVVAAGVASTHPLPESGEVVIGRAAECAVPIDDPSISRRHAVIRMGPPITIEDLGSANGTRLRDQLLAPGTAVPFEVGEIVDLGSVLVTIQAGAARLAPRRVWSHGYFEVRLEDECARAEMDQRRFALLRVLVAHGLEATAPRVIGGLLRPDDVLGEYGPGEYEVLLVDASPADAREMADRVRGALGASSPSLRVGAVTYPLDGRSADELAASAAAAVRAHLGGESADIVVLDPAMLHLHELVRRVAPGDISVLLLGETGVGKEVLAAALHRESGRRDHPLVRLNCAALPEHLLESELFGHEKGAFTGAVSAKPGLLESADGGTVFLDEVGDLPAPVQIKLLRILEDRQVQRLGALRPKQVNVRFVAATNRDLEAAVARGSFREDLYYRIAGITLSIPPLRDRTSEIVPLARAFMAAAARRLGRPTPALSPEATSLLEAYAWPGNIRELRNCMERAVLLCTDGTVKGSHLPTEKMAVPVARPVEAEPSKAEALKALIAGEERQRIEDALQRSAGNQTEAAKLLGVSRRTLSTWLDQYGVARPRKGK